MDNKLQIFNNNEFDGSLRVVEVEGKIMFVASDVAKVLGYLRPTHAINKHCRYTSKCSVAHPQGKGALEVNIIPEGDVYRLIAHSKLPKAEVFESWVFDEVIPSIRKASSFQRPMTQLEILQGAISMLVVQQLELEKIKSAQQKQTESLKAINERIDGVNTVRLNGTKRQCFVSLMRRYIAESGSTYSKGWNDFKINWNTVYHTNLSLGQRWYMKEKNLKKKPNIPEYLEAKGRLDDAIRIADKMLVTVSKE